jgi:hypothetical protein
VPLSRTVGIPLVTGTEERQWLYAAMTRGTDANTMIAFTRSARIADADAGTRPAPELDRHQPIERECNGYLLSGGARPSRVSRERSARM